MFIIQIDKQILNFMMKPKILQFRFVHYKVVVDETIYSDSRILKVAENIILVELFKKIN